MVLFILDSERSSNKDTSAPRMYYRINTKFTLPSVLTLTPGKLYIRSFTGIQNFGSPYGSDYLLIDVSFNTAGSYIQGTTTFGSVNPSDDNVYGPNPTTKFVVQYDTKSNRILWFSSGTFEQSYTVPDTQNVSMITVTLAHNNTFVSPDSFLDQIQPWTLIIEHVPDNKYTN